MRSTGVLDVNSAYSYLLICNDFASTSVVAERDGEIVGFISAYLPPDRDATVFVWQVAVHASARGHGLATRMLLEVAGREACVGVRYLDTTIEPSNEASQALFRGFARRVEAEEVIESDFFTPDMFPADAQHEPEVLFHIGPFDQSRIKPQE